MLVGWNIKNLKQDYLVLNMTYEEPQLISYYFPFDKLNVTFEVPQIFRSAETFGYLEGKLYFQIEIPTQEQEGDIIYDVIYVFGIVLKNAAKGYFFIHLLLKIALSLSL